MSHSILETSTIDKALTWARLLATTATMAPMPGGAAMTGMEGNTTDSFSTSAPTDAAPPSGLVFDQRPGTTGDFEFAAFVLWYLFLVVCCVLPTCCAFRRRRMIEARIAEQHATFERTLRHHNVLVWNHLQQITPEMETEAIKEERTRRITETLQSTTFTVKANDIKEAVTTAESITEENPESGDEDNDSSIRVDEELGGVASTMEQDVMDTKYLTLPSGAEGTTPEKPRIVPAGCAICLCSYEEGDSVTWSSCEDACPHAFHTDCVIPWLAKNKDPKCPCCRQHFCFIEPITEPSPQLSLLTPFGLVPTAVATPVRHLPFFLRGPLRLPMATPDLVIAPRTEQAAPPSRHVEGHAPSLNLSQPYRGPTVPARSNASSSNRQQSGRVQHTPSWMTRLADLRETAPPRSTTETNESEQSSSTA